jgi:hypothetical protein
MPIGHIVEYWIHDSDGGLDCREGKEWRAVRRWIAEAEANPIPKGEDGMILVERVERHFYVRFGLIPIGMTMKWSGRNERRNLKMR